MGDAGIVDDAIICATVTANDVAGQPPGAAIPVMPGEERVLTFCVRMGCIFFVCLFTVAVCFWLEMMVARRTQVLWAVQVNGCSNSLLWCIDSVGISGYPWFAAAAAGRAVTLLVGTGFQSPRGTEASNGVEANMEPPS